ncbi:hypothetical protein BC940DRAFT_53666 [Gongronella butleri]|nr:hypothetical protein BC940DRAFT_53666 [Gongronella butleri]
MAHQSTIGPHACVPFCTNNHAFSCSFLFFCFAFLLRFKANQLFLQIKERDEHTQKMPASMRDFYDSAKKKRFLLLCVVFFFFFFWPLSVFDMPFAGIRVFVAHMLILMTTANEKKRAMRVQ